MVVSPKMKIAALGAAWFALVAGLGLPIVMAMLPFASSVNFLQVGQQVVGGLQLFGPSAAVVGFLLANRVVTAGVSGCFLLGVALVALTCIVSGFLHVFMVRNLVALQAVASEGLIAGMGYLLIDVVFFKCVPFLAGGLAALAFRRMAIGSGVLLSAR